MLARGIRTDSGSVASAMLTALLRSRLGFWPRWISGSVSTAGATIPAWNCLNPSREERKKANRPQTCNETRLNPNISWVVGEVHQNHHPRPLPQLNLTIFAPRQELHASSSGSESLRGASSRFGCLFLPILRRCVGFERTEKTRRDGGYLIDRGQKRAFV